MFQFWPWFHHFVFWSECFELSSFKWDHKAWWSSYARFTQYQSQNQLNFPPIRSMTWSPVPSSSLSSIIFYKIINLMRNKQTIIYSFCFFSYKEWGSIFDEEVDSDFVVEVGNYNKKNQIANSKEQMAIVSRFGKVKDIFLFVLGGIFSRKLCLAKIFFIFFQVFLSFSDWFLSIKRTLRGNNLTFLMQ